MAILWVGDFRLNQLQNYQIKIKNTGINSIFLTDDNAEYGWLNDVIIEQLPQMTLDNVDVVVMSGFNDCVQSCALDTSDINDIADDYIKLLNDAVEDYENVRFYFCTVCPIDAAYPFAYYKSSDTISQSSLDAKIKKFNERIKDKCKATIIDSYKYLSETTFATRDGVRFDFETCRILQSFIMSHLSPASASCFMSRVRATLDDAPSPFLIQDTSDPDVDADGNTIENADDSYTYWVSKEASEKDSKAKVLGLNLCKEHAKSAANYHAVLPSNVGYVYGRFLEILGIAPPLPEKAKEDPDAENIDKPPSISLPTNKTRTAWWTKEGEEKKTEHSYTQGSDPQLGSIICWETNAGYIHVAIVEYIDKKTNSLTVSKSYDVDAPYDPKNTGHFNVLTLPCVKVEKTDADGKKIEVSTWGTSNNLKFLGFLYAAASMSMSANKTGLCTKNSYGITVEEMQPNAQYIWQYFGSRGWTMNAVAALIGNMQEESKLSPAVWEGCRTDCTTAGGTQLTSTGRNFKNGFGLVQWTPATKFFNWCENTGSTGNANGTGTVLPFYDMDTQLKRIEAEVEISEKSWVEGLSQWMKKESKGYDLTFKDFITSTKDAYWLAGAFAFCYERPARSTGTIAEQNALRKDRGEYANYWYSYLSGAAPLSFTAGLPAGSSVADNVFKVTNFKIDKCLPTQVFASFVAANGDTGTYKLYKGNTFIDEDELEIGEDGIVAFSIKNLTPNTKYTLKLDVTGKAIETLADSSESDSESSTDSEDDKTSEAAAEPSTLSNEVSFTTPQDYPESIKFINLSCDDKIKSINSAFKLTISEPKYLGYWKKVSCGYEKMLFINNKCVKTITEVGVKTIRAKKLTLKEEFGYTCKMGDSVQIGIRVWVKDDKGNKLYDSNVATMSESICILNKPVLTHLRTKID